MYRNIFIFTFFLLTTASFSANTENEIIDNTSINLYHKIYSEHLKTLSHLDQKNRPLLILFSGTPAMGKSTVAKILKKKLSGIRIVSDDIRILFRDSNINPQHFVDETNRTYLETYFPFLLANLCESTENHLFIFDMSCDRLFDKFKALANKHNIPIFTIRLDLSLEETKNRIISRDIEPDNFLKYIDKWYMDYTNFDKKNCDYTLDVSKSIEDLPINDLIDSILSRMETNVIPHQISLEN